MDKSALFAKRGVKTKAVTIPDVGEVKVRCLTRKEALSIQDRDMDESEAERKLLSLALVDPEMDEAEVGRWQDVAIAGELTPVVDAILALSAMTVDAPKEKVKGFRG